MGGFKVKNNIALTIDNIASSVPGLETSHVMRISSIVKRADTPCYGRGLP